MTVMEAESAEVEKLSARIVELEADLREADEIAEGLREDISDRDHEIDQLKEEFKLERDHESDAVHHFLDIVQRPVGEFKFTVPTGPETDRAILGLFDAIGRNP